jgi:hypothetical protein
MAQYSKFECSGMFDLEIEIRTHFTFEFAAGAFSQIQLFHESLSDFDMDNLSVVCLRAPAFCSVDKIPNRSAMSSSAPVLLTVLYLVAVSVKECKHAWFTGRISPLFESSARRGADRPDCGGGSEQSKR